MGVIFVLCAYLYLLNASSFIFVLPLSMGWPVVVLFCCRELSVVVDTPFSECAVLVVWPSSALISCFAAVLDCHFFVQDCGLSMLVDSLGAFTTPSMLVIWVCGDVSLWVYRCLFLLLGFSVFSIHFRLSLLVYRFFWFGPFQWQSLG